MKRPAIGILAISAVSPLFCAMGAWLYLHPGRGPHEKVDPHAKGYLETVEGLPVIHLKGSAYEMGYQQGALAREHVAASVGSFQRLLQMVHDDTGVPAFVFNLLLDGLYRRSASYIPPYQIRELEGLADASGVDIRILRRMHVMSELEQRNCSSFAVFGKATEGGKLYHGHNMDWDMSIGLQDQAALFLYEPDNGIPFAAFGYFGMVGHSSGMNMNGVSIGVIGAVTKDSRYVGIPFMSLLRDVLQNAHGLDEASAILASAHRTVGYNYVFSCADTPSAKAYETSAHQYAAFSDNDPKETVEYAIRIESAVFRADEAMDPTVRRSQRCARGYPNMPYGCNSYDHRYKGMATRIQQNYGRIDAQTALSILKSVAMDGTNLHSVLCNTTDREMWVARARGMEDACKQHYIHIDLKQQFLRPDQRARTGAV